MVIYFANRNSRVIGTASSELPQNNTLIDDLMTDDLASGVKTYECTLIATDEIKEAAVSGNYLLADGQLYTIMSDDYNNYDQTIELYCEDAGLDLLNRYCPAIAKTSKTFEQWVKASIDLEAAGWTLNFSGVNKSASKTLEYTSNATATERLSDIISNYNAEMYFTYSIDGFKWIKRTINFTNARGNQTNIHALYMDKDIDKIIRKRNVENLATVWYMTGKDNVRLAKLSGYSSAQKNFTRDGHTFKVSGSDVICTDAMQKWSSSLDTDGRIVQAKQTDYTDAASCINYAVREMVKIVDPVTNYEVSLKSLYDGAQCGDKVHVLDTHNDILLAARIIELQKSFVSGDATITLGDYTALKSSKAALNVEAISQIFSLSITSDSGLIGKNSLSTILRVSVYLNGSVITSADELPVGHLVWYEDNVQIDSSDSRISDDGFTFTTGTLTTGHTYKCALED